MENSWGADIPSRHVFSAELRIHSPILTLNSCQLIGSSLAIRRRAFFQRLFGRVSSSASTPDGASIHPYIELANPDQGVDKTP